MQTREKCSFGDAYNMAELQWEATRINQQNKLNKALEEKNTKDIQEWEKNQNEFSRQLIGIHPEHNVFSKEEFLKLQDPEYSESADAFSVEEPPPKDNVLFPEVDSEDDFGQRMETYQQKLMEPRVFIQDEPVMQITRR
jgi:hypothetical protein